MPVIHRVTPVKRRNIAPKQNEIIYNTTNYKMSVSPIESCQDEFNIVTESEMDFFGPLMRFHFYGIPSVLLGHTIDLTKKSDIPLSFDFGNRLEWHASPDEISGAIAETNMDPQTGIVCSFGARAIIYPISRYYCEIENEI